MSSEEKPSRRKAMRKLALLPIGAAAFIAGIYGFKYLSKPSYLNIKVQYSLMSALIEPNPESLQVESPSTLYDAEKILWERHPALQTMETMQVFLNGSSVLGNPSLKEGDEVLFLAMYAGG